MTTATAEAPKDTPKKKRTRRPMPVAIMLAKGSEIDHEAGREGETWELADARYDTVAEAEAMLEKAPPGRYLIVRVAGTYDVEEVKAKAVKRT